MTSHKDVHEIAGFYVLTMSACLGLLCIVSWMVRRVGFECIRFATWPRLGRWVASVLVYSLCVVPFATLIISAVLGFSLAALENWSAFDGFEYVLSNAAGLYNPLTDVMPQSTLGNLVDLAISTIALLLETTLMGIASAFSIVTAMACVLPESPSALARYVLLYAPASMFAMGAASGAIMAMLEDWSFFDGFLYMSSALCGLIDPLTDVEASTASGAFFEVICLSAEYTLAGALLGVLNAHPSMPKVIAFFEGETVEEVLQEREAVLRRQRSACESKAHTESSLKEGSIDFESMNRQELIEHAQEVEAAHKMLPDHLSAGMGLARAVEILSVQLQAERELRMSLEKDLAAGGTRALRSLPGDSSHSSQQCHLDTEFPASDSK